MYKKLAALLFLTAVAISGTGGTTSSAPEFDPNADARQLFAEKKLPADLPLSSIGTYSNGCIAGAVALPLAGKYYQVMRPSRNRYWGHPRTIEFLKKLAVTAHKDGWNGLLIGDLSMPRGGPMPKGHASHQIGLDVDIWLTPMPARRKLTGEELENMESASVLKIDSAELDPHVWTEAHANLVRDAARSKHVARIFVTPAIKQYLCSKKAADGSDAWWLSRIRPCYEGVCEGHDDHIHVRLDCLEGDCNCHNQEPVNSADDGSGDELTEALKQVALHPPYTSKSPGPDTPRAPFPLSEMPPQAVDVLKAPDVQP
ncbi:MAG: penicillin-insensitive murein endopeptidase [Candidatus Obscuribacterales bacterium]